MTTGLVTLLEVAAWRETSVGELGDKVDLLIDLASDLVRDATTQRLGYQADDVIEVTTGGALILLPELPVWAVTLVEFKPWSTTGAGTYEELTVDTDYVLELGRDNRVAMLHLLSRSLGWARVTYDHGYAVPGELAERDDAIVVPRLPGAIRGIILDAIDRALNVPAGIRQEMAGRSSALYTGDGSPLYLTKAEVGILARWRPGGEGGTT